MRYADNYCTYTEVYKPKHVYIFTGKCVQTGKEYSVSVPSEELYNYRQGMHIQNAMPSVSREDAEFLISGLSPEGWNEIFKEEDE